MAGLSFSLAGLIKPALKCQLATSSSLILAIHRWPLSQDTEIKTFSPHHSLFATINFKTWMQQIKKLLDQGFVIIREDAAGLRIKAKTKSRMSGIRCKEALNPYSEMRRNGCSFRRPTHWLRIEQKAAIGTQPLLPPAPSTHKIFIQ